MTFTQIYEESKYIRELGIQANPINIKLSDLDCQLKTLEAGRARGLIDQEPFRQQQKEIYKKQKELESNLHDLHEKARQYMKKHYSV